MSKAILIIIIVIVVLIAVIWGIYFLVATPGSNIIPQEQNNNQNSNMDIQGMKVEVLKEGSGTAAKNDDNVTVHYTGMLADGKVFDSSIDRNAPFTFQVGKERVIKGWDLGVVGMKVGEKRKLTIPPALAYGATGFLMIPANATLTFEVELLKIN